MAPFVRRQYGDALYGVMREVKGGAIDHLTKPFLPEELEEVVARALEASQESVDERRRVLQTEAEIYGSMGDLVDDVRSNPDDKKKR